MTLYKSPKPFRGVILSAISVLAVGSLSSASLAKSSESVLEAPVDSALLGDFLAGTYADLLDDSEARSFYFTRAFEASPEDVRLGRRAATAALTTGDFDLALRHAKKVHKIDKTEAMAQTILAIDAFSRGRHKSVSRYIDSESSDITMGTVMNLTEGWNLVALGKADEARDHFEKMTKSPYFSDLAKLQIAKIDAIQGNIDLANAAFEALQSPNQARVETVLSAARFFANSGQTDKALERLEKYIAESGLESGPLRLYTERLKAGKSIDRPLKPKQQLSRVLTDPSYEFFLRNRAPDVADVYLRLALQLDPKHEKAQLWLASLLDNTERSEAAMKIYKAFPDSSSYVVSARLSEANIYFDREEDDKALAVLEDINRKKQTFVTREALGRARLIRENYEDALPIYTSILESMNEEEIRENTQPLYFRGICYERTKQWDKAEADFLRVLEIEPDNADALNYLGYTWVDRGENLNRAFEMIRRAVALEPDSGAITDSLGWAHYKLGEYEDAKIQLEKAVELSPSSATIVDHLGDVYWKLGRYREAGYQWERALLYDPTDEERETIHQKLKSGLPAATPDAQ